MALSEIISLGVGGLMTIVTGIVLYILKGYIADLKRYRSDREERERELEQKQQAKDELLLGMARVALLENYQKCEQKGYYSLEDREVYGKLFDAYVTNGGDGVIDQIAPKIRSLPTTPPNHQGDDVS